MTEPAIQLETEAARAPVPAPEGRDETADGARKPAPPPESKEAPKVPHPEPALMPYSVLAPEPSGNVIVLESVREKAEQNLTKYLAPRLAEALRARGQSEEMITQLFADSHIGLYGELTKGKTDVKITLSGPNVGPNEALLGELLVEALKEHPQCSALFAGEYPPHAQKVPGQEHTLLQVHFPQLDTASYAQLIQGFATQAEPVRQDIPAAAEAANDNAAETIPETTISDVAEHEKAPASAKAIG